MKGLIEHSLNTHNDSRGNLTEIFRGGWISDSGPVQWNYVRSKANVLRGFHLHHTHTDYLVVLEGLMHLVLKDLRPESETYLKSKQLKLSGAKLTMVEIAPGIGHGFYFPTPSNFVYGVSHYWNRNDELGCRWDDPLLEVEWEVNNKTPILSDTDTNASDFKVMLERFHALRSQSGKENS